MQMFTRIAGAGIAISAMVAAAGAVYAGTQTFTATAEVTKTITITENTPLSFGTVHIVDDKTIVTGANPTGTIDPDDGSWSSGTGAVKLIQLGTPTRGNITVFGGSESYMTIRVTFPAGATLSNPSPIANDFALTDFQITTPAAGDFDPNGATGTLALCNAALVGGGDCDMVTSGMGEITLDFGATIASTEDLVYPAGSYTGTYTVTAVFY